ncbi:MAG: hypothetical protein OEZ22_01190 [Spirochaetia bacterium]|nr:hypothetical protein [Spirochaetia bacterium]
MKTEIEKSSKKALIVWYFMLHFAIFIHIAIIFELLYQGKIQIAKEQCDGIRAEKKSIEIPVVIETKSQTPLDVLMEQQKSKEELQKERQENPDDFFESYNYDKEKWSGLKDRLKDSVNLLKDYEQVFEQIINENNVSESYIYRKRHYEDIAVKDVFPTLETIEKPFSEILKKAPQELRDYHERNKIIDDFRKWTQGELVTAQIKAQIIKDKKKGYPPLSFPALERDDYFNQTLPLPKEEQFAEFRQKYLEHDPNKGDLPMALRELYYKNLQRLAYVFSRDSTYFNLDYFEENLNKEDFLKNSLEIASKLDGSKTSIEMLFAIENIYEIQQRALRYLYDFKQKYANFPPEKKKQLRIESIRRVVERYLPLLEKKNIKSYNDVVTLYSNKRLEIMQHILNSAPQDYRRNDALFEKGRILWDKGTFLGSETDFDEAIKVWNKIPKNAKVDKYYLNGETIKNLRPLINQYKTTNNKLEKLQIRNKISITIQKHLQEYLNEKRKREEIYLWPPSSPAPFSPAP